MPKTSHPGPVFKDNLAQLPPLGGIDRLDLCDTAGVIVASIENRPGKQGSLAVYLHLAQSFDIIDAEAARHGLAIFAELTDDARNRPGDHPNIDRLLDIAAGSEPLKVIAIPVQD